MLHQLARDVSLGDQLLDDAGIVGKLLVMTDEHTELVVVHAHIALHHGVWNFIIVAYVFV